MAKQIRLGLLLVYIRRGYSFVHAFPVTGYVVLGMLVPSNTFCRNPERGGFRISDDVGIQAGEIPVFYVGLVHTVCKSDPES